MLVPGQAPQPVATEVAALVSLPTLVVAKAPFGERDP